MSGHGAPTDQPFDCSDLRVAVVASSARWAPASSPSITWVCRGRSSCR